MLTFPGGVRQIMVLIALCGAGSVPYWSGMSETDPQALATLDQFQRLDIRVGTVIDARPFHEARAPALQLWIDFGETIGVKRSSAQITVHYKPDQLIGRQVCAVVNFPPRQIGPFLSEVLTLGVPGEGGEVILVRPDFTVPDGGRLY